MPHFERVCSSVVLHTGTELGLCECVHILLGNNLCECVHILLGNNLCECVHILLGNNLPPVMKHIILIKVLSHLFAWSPATVMSGPCEHDSKAVIKWPEKNLLVHKISIRKQSHGQCGNGNNWPEPEKVT